MHDPVLLVMAVQPAVEGGPVWALGFQRRRQCQLPPVPGCSKQVNDGIAPLGHQGCAAEVQGFPAFTIRGDSAPGHRQVNVDVPGQAAAKGMQDGKDPHEYLLFFTNFQDHPGRQPGQVIEQVTVVTEQFPECIWHGEGDVLPGAIGHHGLLLLHPLIGEFLATRGTEPAFAGERHVFTKLTVRVAALVYRDTANVAYENMMTPYEKFKSLAKSEQYLKKGITLEDLQAQADSMSDNEAAERLQSGRETLFKTIFERKA